MGVDTIDSGFQIPNSRLVSISCDLESGISNLEFR
jgi:hypothetical protein